MTTIGVVRHQRVKTTVDSMCTANRYACIISTTATKVMHLNLYKTTVRAVSSVGIATGYRLDGPGSNLGGDEIFRSSRPALGPTQPPVQWVPVLSRG